MLWLAKIGSIYCTQRHGVFQQARQIRKGVNPSAVGSRTKISQNYRKNAYFGLFRSSPSTDFFIIGFIVSAYPIYVEISRKVFYHFPQIDFKGLLSQKFWRVKPQNSWTSLRDTLRRLAYSESEDLFTSNGFFKNWNKLTEKMFPIFGLYFARTLHMTILQLVNFDDSKWPA